MAVTVADSTWKGPVKGEGLRRHLSLVWKIESNRLAIWSPLFLVMGIWFYFSLPREPAMALAGVALALALAVMLWVRANRLLLIVALALAGFGIAKLRAEWVATPLLRSFVPAVTLEGWVNDIDNSGNRSRILIVDVSRMAGVPLEEVPRSVRLKAAARMGTDLRVGDLIGLEASLSPLPRPVAPGSFDYGRQLYFHGIGATGRVSGAILRHDRAVPWSYRLRRLFHDLRTGIGARVRTAVKGQLGGFAEALITGERASISRSLNDSLQASGLYHILSISGLHMSLVAGGAFWAVRALLALFPGLALRYSIKKWAAAAALLVGLFYMLLADSGAATERAFIMIGVVFFAVLVDRPAISLHNLAVAALLILLREPEQALSASFQMSFMAVMGIAAFFPAYEALAARLRPSPSARLTSKWGRSLALLVLASLATSLIAGSLSSIPAAHHFGRLAPFAVVANALALPLVGLVVMPMAMLGVLLMPLGLEAAPLRAMEIGLEGVVWISDWVSSWPLAQSHWPLLPAPAAILLSLAAALLCLSASPLRWLTVPVALGALLFVGPSRPYLLFDDRAANVAVLTADGYVPAVPKAAAFSVGRWLRQAGDRATVSEAARRPAWSCRENFCFSAKAPSVLYLRRAAERQRICQAADIVLAEFPLRGRCQGRRTTLDRFDVWRNGAHAVYVSGSSIETVSATEARGERPWVQSPRPRNGNVFSRRSP